MGDVFVLSEHRRGELRDVTFEMLAKASELAETMSGGVTALLLGYDVKVFQEKVAGHAEKVLVVEDEKLKDFNSDVYQKVLTHLVKENKPSLLMIGHTAYGIELAPRLAVDLDAPLASDCISLDFNGGVLNGVRQMYGGKVNVEFSLRDAETYIATIRPAAFEAKEAEGKVAEIVCVPSPLKEAVEKKKFLGYIEPEVGEVDVTAADVIIAIGRGIKDEDNISMVKTLADALGGVLACSRPIVDKEWLPKDRQVGSSGKTVKPKLYIAIGVSGAFQHVTGMKASDLTIVVNKDPKAPFFGVADYGVVDDLFKVVPALKNKIYEVKSKS